jgi:hypothetical protein
MLKIPVVSFEHLASSHADQQRSSVPATTARPPKNFAREVTNCSKPRRRVLNSEHFPNKHSKNFPTAFHPVDPANPVIPSNASS